jgi:hypothetical protein
VVLFLASSPINSLPTIVSNSRLIQFTFARSVDSQATRQIEAKPPPTTTLPFSIQSFGPVDRSSAQLIATITCKHRSILPQSNPRQITQHPY